TFSTEIPPSARSRENGHLSSLPLGDLKFKNRRPGTAPWLVTLNPQSATARHQQRAYMLRKSWAVPAHGPQRRAVAFCRRRLRLIGVQWHRSSFYHARRAMLARAWRISFETARRSAIAALVRRPCR